MSDSSNSFESSSFEPDSAPAPGEPPPSPIAATAVRFCRTCGAPWESDWESCPHCAARSVNSNDAQAIFQRERGDVRSATFLYFSLLSVSVISLFVAIARQREFGVVGELVIETLMSIIVVAWCAVGWRELLPLLRSPARPVWFILAILAAIPTFVIAHFAVAGLHKMFDVESLRYLDSYRQEGYGFRWAVLGMCVQPAIFEELAFRGTILGALQRVLESNEALFVSAAMFAILHLSVASIPHLFLLGFVLGWIRLRSGSILPGMLLHFTHNLLAIVTEQYGGSVMPW